MSLTLVSRRLVVSIPPSVLFPSFVPLSACGLRAFSVTGHVRNTEKPQESKGVLGNIGRWFRGSNKNKEEQNVAAVDTTAVNVNAAGTVGLGPFVKENLVAVKAEEPR